MRGGGGGFHAGGGAVVVLTSRVRCSRRRRDASRARRHRALGSFELRWNVARSTFRVRDRRHGQSGRSARFNVKLDHNVKSGAVRETLAPALSRARATDGMRNPNNRARITRPPTAACINDAMGQWLVAGTATRIMMVGPRTASAKRMSIYGIGNAYDDSSGLRL